MDTSAKRILLIEPPFYRLFKNTYSLDRYPLSLGYLAGVIREKTDWQVQVYNADFTAGKVDSFEVRYLAGEGFQNYRRELASGTGPVWQEIRSALGQFQPRVVGITAKSQNFSSACIVARLAKETNPACTVVVGGPHPSMATDSTMKCREFDVAVRGEGEQTIVELLAALNGERALSSVDGLVLRQDGRLVTTPPRQLLTDLDSLPFPHTHAPEVLKDFDRYSPDAFKFIFATRGCPYNCFFCGSRTIWSRKVRFRSIPNVIREIQSVRKMGVQRISFDDDTFGVTKKNILDLCQAMARDCPGLVWDCELHVKLVDDDTLRAMKSAGCVRVDLGIESGNNEILKVMRKNITIEEAEAACRTIRRHGVLLHALFMVGFPQETEETFNDTVRAIKTLPCNGFVYSIFNPYPGTEAFEFCKQKGLIGEDYDASLHNHQSPESCFCMNISRERFRELAGTLEKYIDRRHRMELLKRCFSREAFHRAREIGLRRGMRVVLRALFRH